MSLLVTVRRDCLDVTWYAKFAFCPIALELLMHVTGPVLDDPGTMQANHSVSLAYYLSLVIAILLAILSIIGVIAMLRLFLFHIRLGKYYYRCHI